MSGVTIEITRDDGLGQRNPRLVADGSRWRVEEGGLEGFGGVSYEVSSREYAQYDGAALLAERTPVQDRTIVLAARGNSGAARDEAMGFFIPHREYTVRCTAMGRTRHFKGRQYAMEVELGSLARPTRVTWTCISMQPFWLSEDEHGVDIAEAEGRRGFPFVSLADRFAPEPEGDRSDGDRAGHVAGFVVGVVSNTVSLTNGGHVPTYPRFTVTCTGGTVVNPTVRVLDRNGGTAMEVAMGATMADGDVLVLDFGERPTVITLNGRNVTHLARPGSTLAASIGVGRYTVEWGADSGDAAMRVVPSIRERYTGI